MWFMLAWRYGFHPGMVMPPQGGAIQKHIRQETGLDFNSGRPMPPATWMVDEDEYETGEVQEALNMLGLSVNPIQAVLAASLLAHPPTAQSAA